MAKSNRTARIAEVIESAETAVDETIEAELPPETTTELTVVETVEDETPLDFLGRPVVEAGSIDSIVYAIQEFDGIDTEAGGTWDRLVTASVARLSEVSDNDKLKVIKKLFADASQAYIKATYRTVLPKHLNPENGNCTSITARGKDGKFLYLPSSYPSAQSSIVSAIKFNVSLTDGKSNKPKSQLEREVKIARFAEQHGIDSIAAEIAVDAPKAPKTDAERAKSHFEKLLKALQDMDNIAERTNLVTDYRAELQKLL